MAATSHAKSMHAFTAALLVPHCGHAPTRMVRRGGRCYRRWKIVWPVDCARVDVLNSNTDDGTHPKKDRARRRVQFSMTKITVCRDWSQHGKRPRCEIIIKPSTHIYRAFIFSRGWGAKLCAKCTHKNNALVFCFVLFRCQA